MAAWQQIDTIPRDRMVMVVSAKERIRKAKVRYAHGGLTLWIKRSDKYGPRRVLCRTEKGGDIWARAWKEIEE